MKKTILTTLLVASAALTGSAQAAQLVQNGSFSSLPGGYGLIGASGATAWTTTGYNIAFDNGSHTYSTVALWDSSNNGNNTWNGAAPGGVNFVAMDGDYNTAAVTQTISGLVVGQSYTFSFDYAFAQQVGYTGATNQSLGVTLGSTSVFNSGTYVLPTKGFSGWSVVTTTVTATSGTEVLSFLAASTPAVPPFALFTGVSLVGPTSVPEPATWGMMIIGLGAMGVAARRRRRATATA